MSRVGSVAEQTFTRLTWLWLPLLAHAIHIPLGCVCLCSAVVVAVSRHRYQSKDKSGDAHCARGDHYTLNYCCSLLMLPAWLSVSSLVERLSTVAQRPTLPFTVALFSAASVGACSCSCLYQPTLCVAHSSPKMATDLLIITYAATVFLCHCLK